MLLAAGCSEGDDATLNASVGATTAPDAATTADAALDAPDADARRDARVVTDGDARCTTMDDIIARCPVGQVTYTYGGGREDSGVWNQADAGRFVCGDFANLLRACMAYHFPGLPTYYQVGGCSGGSRHAVVTYYNPCTGQRCIVQPYRVRPGSTRPAECCWNAPPYSGTGVFDIPVQCLAGPSTRYFNPFLCDPGQSASADQPIVTPNHCSYSSGNFTCCDATVCRVCGELGTNIGPYYDASYDVPDVALPTPPTTPRSPPPCEPGAPETCGEVDEELVCEACSS